MNFVFHRHLAHRDLGSATAGLGAMLPDLWRMADRRMRARHDLAKTSKLAFEQLTAPAMDLQAGIEHHLEVDAWFHNHPVFEEGMKACQQAFDPFEAPKLKLFGHIAWELCLDGAFLRRQGVGQEIGRVRDSLAAGKEAPLGEVARLHRPDLEPQDLESLFEGLEGLLNSLHEGDWIAGYATGDGLVGRLEGVRRRFDFARFGDAIRAELASVFEGLLSIAAGGVEELLARD